MGNRDTRIGGGEVGTEVYAVVNDLQRTVKNALLAQGEGTGILIDLPTVDTSFTPIFETDGDDIYVTLAFFIPGFTDELTVFTLDSTLVTNEATYNSKRKKYTIADISDADRAAQRIERRIEIPLKPERLHHIPMLRAWDGDSPHTNPEDGFDYSGYPGNVLFSFTTTAVFGTPSAPDASLIVFNRLDEHTPDEGDAEVGLKVYAPLTVAGAAQTYAQAAGAGNAVRVKCWLTREVTGDANPEQLPFEKLLSEAELTQVDAASTPANRGYIIMVCNNLKAGAPYIWTDNVLSLGAYKKTASAVVPFNAANFQTNLSNLTSVSLTFDNTPPYDDLVVSVDLNLTQPATVVAMRNFTLRRKLSTDGSYPATDLIHRDNKVNSDAYHVPSTAFVIRLAEIKVKPSKTYNVQVVLRGRGNATPLTLNGTFSTSASGSVLADTAIPTLATNPDTGTTGPTVTERHSKIDISCPLPSANINTLDNYQVVLQSANTTITGDPVVGVSDVLVIKYGQNPTFNLSYFASFSDQFYVKFRAHNSVGYSVWSVGTNQNGYNRPIQDFIGTGVPTQSMGLLASGTGAASPANTTTTYNISTADSTDYQALITAGMVIHLVIPTVGAADVVRLASSYSLANHRFTLSVAYSAAPANSIGYEIHQGNTLGEKSGTGHSTTVINLGTLGAALADNTLLGYSVYLPSFNTTSGQDVDEIRKITAHAGGAITLESATAVALANNACYLICRGSYGYAAVNPLSGIISAAPFRVWFNSDTVENILEIIMPTGENAFSLQAIDIVGIRKSNGVTRMNFKGNISVTPSYPMIAPAGFVPIWKARLRNLYRESGSDGWSTYSSNVEGYQNTAVANYLPGTYVPPDIDYQGESSYPDSGYPSYQ